VDIDDITRKHSGQCFVEEGGWEMFGRAFCSMFILWRVSCRRVFPILQRSFDPPDFSCKALIIAIIAL